MTPRRRNPARTRIKICGIAAPEAVRAAIDAGADAIGFVFAPGTPRYVTPELARAILAAVDPFPLTVVSVHRNPTWPPDPDTFAAIEVGTRQQMHGDEDEELLGMIGRPVIRGFAFDPDEVRRWDGCPHVGTLLIDGPAGGSGATFDHDRLAAMMPDVSKPVVLAGGLTPENVGEAIARVRPFAVDVSSGVESAPGTKDVDRIHAFCAAVRDADAG